MIIAQFAKVCDQFHLNIQGIPKVALWINPFLAKCNVRHHQTQYKPKLPLQIPHPSFLKL
jgi:hypothetical protein